MTTEEKYPLFKGKTMRLTLDVNEVLYKKYDDDSLAMGIDIEVLVISVLEKHAGSLDEAYRALMKFYSDDKN